MNLTKYRVSPNRVLLAYAPWLVAIVPCAGTDESTEAPPEGFVEFLAQRASKPPAAAYETTLTELKSWVERSKRARDRQRILGGIYDRAILRQGLDWLEKRLVPLDAKVRLETVRSPHHGKAHRVLSLRCDDWECFLMCCAVGTRTGRDPLPRGRAA